MGARALYQLLRIAGRQVLAAAIVVWIIAAPQTVNAQIAFPGAEGVGRNATGGRGGDVYYVTNLNDSGAGSLRRGIETANAPRTILFQVDGTIHLQSDLLINKSNITIAGQSAPGGGITLADRMTHMVGVHDVVVQYLRFRVGDTNTQVPNNTYEPDSLWVDNSKNIMIDHVTASWGVDETLSVTNASNNVTVQWSMITDALRDAGHPKGEHGYGSLIGGNNITYAHNLYANNDSRNPRPSDSVKLDFVNNVISNPGFKYGYSSADNPLQMNYVGNYGIDGPSTSAGALYEPDTTNTKIYFSDNYHDTNKNGLLDSQAASGPTLVNGSYTPLGSRVNLSPVNTTDPRTAYIEVMSHAGANRVADAHDRNTIRDVINQNGSIIDSQNQQGGWPTLAHGVSSADVNNDGVPDWFATASGFAPGQAINNLVAVNGYTYLENYLQSLTPNAYPVTNTESIRISTAQGRGADGYVTENGGDTATSGGNGTAATLNSRWAEASSNVNEMIVLKFDLAHLTPNSLTDARLELTTAVASLGNHTFRVYGIEPDAPNVNWNELNLDFATTPGLTFDGHSYSLGINPNSRDVDHVLSLGEFTLPASAAGTTLTFNNANLAVFLNFLSQWGTLADTSIATIILEQTNVNVRLAQFYSKEGNADLAPRLVLQGVPLAVPEPATIILAASGAVGLWFAGSARRRKRRAHAAPA